MEEIRKIIRYKLLQFFTCDLAKFSVYYSMIRNDNYNKEKALTKGVTQTNSLDVKTKGDIMSNATTTAPPPSTNLEITVESVLYSNKIQEAVDKLNTPENIKAVNSGERGSVTEFVTIPLGYIGYVTREEGLAGVECKLNTILNSFYNREPFLNDLPTFVSKTAYLIRWFNEVASFGRLPISLISNPKDSQESGIQMENCLLAKDRGHFMTVFKMMVTEGRKLDEAFWKKVRTKLLKETNKGNSTPASLVKFQETGLMGTISDLNSKGQVEYSLKDLIPSSWYDKIYTEAQILEIRLETIETHKTEIQKENNGENDWTPHNFGLTELTDELISNADWGYNQSEVDKLCSDSPTMRGENTFLASRKSAKFSGSHTEPLMLSKCYENSPFDYKTYEKLAGEKNRSQTYVKGIADTMVTTDDMKVLLSRIESVATVEDDNGYNSWLKVKDAIDDHYDEWAENMDSTTSKFSALRPTSMDTSLIYYKGLEMTLDELNYKRKRKGTLELVTKDFCDYFVDLIENNTSVYETWVVGKSGKGGAEASWKGKFNKIIKRLFDRFIKEQLSSQGKAISPVKLKEMKVRDLRRGASNVSLPLKFKMYDNPRDEDKPNENKFKWEIIDVDLTNVGKSLALCHYESEANGGNHTIENTFIGPGGDNNRMGEEDCPKNYMSTDGDFLKRFFKDVPEPGISDDNAASWMNTVVFSKLSEIV